MIKVVIFDFDDTLCLTEEASFLMENTIAIDMGHQPMKREAHQKNWGKPVKEAIAERILGIDSDEFMQRFEQVMAEFVVRGKLDAISQETIDVLRVLKAHSKQLAVLTSRTLPEVKHLIHENHILTKVLNGFYYKDKLQYSKPDPRVFSTVLSDFGVKPYECVYVGDAIGDAVAAKGAGMHFIAVLESGLRTKKDFAQKKVDLFVDTLRDIVPYIIQTE